MKKLIFPFLFFSSFVYAQQTIIISEVMFKPLTNETVNEYVEFFNTSFSDSVDLTTFSVKDNLGTSNFVWQSGTKKVGPRSFALLIDATYFEQGSGEYEGMIPNNTPVYKTSNASIGNALGNTSDSVMVYTQPNGGGTMTSKLKWTVSNTSAGYSIEKINLDLSPFEAYPSSNTALSTVVKGTPGYANSVSPLDYDAAVISVENLTTNPTILDSVQIKTVLKNNGLQNLSNITFQIFADTSLNLNYENNEKFYESTLSLSSNETKEVVVKIKPNKVGTFKLKSVVSQNQDQKVDNNTKEIQLTISDVTYYDVGIESFTLQTQTHNYKGDSIKATISVKNYGISTLYNLPISLRDQFSFQKNIVLDSLKNNESKSFVMYYPMTYVGNIQLIAKVNHSQDQNHVNDSLVKNLTVERFNNLKALSLSEIMYNPTGPEGNNENEFVEFFNTSYTDTVDLTGLIIKDLSTASTLLPYSGSMLLKPRQYAVVHPPTYYPMVVKLYNGIEDTINTLRLKTSTSSIGNGLGATNDAVYLLDSSADTLDFHTWNVDVGDGYSVEKIDLDIRKTTSNWVKSLNKNGSPGKVNSVNKYTIDGSLTTPNNIAVFENAVVQFNYTLKNNGKQILNNARIVVYEDSDFNNLPDQTDSIGSVVLSNLGLLNGDSTTGSLTLNKTFTSLTQFLIYLRISGDENPMNNLAVTKLTFRMTKGSILVSEFMFDPINSTTDFLKNQPEYVELYNPGDKKILLKNWVLGDKVNENGQSNKLTITDSLFIYPKGYAVIASDSSLLTYWNYFSRTDTMNTYTILNKSNLNLNNDFDAIIIYDSFNTVIDSLGYYSSWHNPSYASTKGISLERRSFTAASNDPYNWGSSTNLPSGGTPGKPNSIGVSYLPTTSEIVLSPNPFSPDNDGWEDVVLITYQLKSEVNFVRVRVFDRIGRLINELKNYSQAGSSGQIFWDGKNSSGQIVPMGSYILLIEGFNSENQQSESIKKVVVVAKKL